MVKVGLVQVGTVRTNEEGISKVSEILIKMGKKKTEIVCLPEQWLKNNRISNFEDEFAPFFEIAKKYRINIIPGAFYQRNPKGWTISAPVIGKKGSIIGTQEKIHPFDYERKFVKPGIEAKVFDSGCKFGIIICYDMVFPNVISTMVKKGAKIILSPSRIVKRGILPWNMYVQVRALENRIPIIASNVENYKFGGSSLIVDLREKNKVVIPKITKLKGQDSCTKNFDLSKYDNMRRLRYSDARNFS